MSGWSRSRWRCLRRSKVPGTYLEIPASYHPPIEQAAVVLASSQQKALARQFIDYLKKPETVQILKSDGFAVPQTTR